MRAIRFARCCVLHVGLIISYCSSYRSSLRVFADSNFSSPRRKRRYFYYFLESRRTRDVYVRSHWDFNRRLRYKYDPSPKLIDRLDYLSSGTCVTTWDDCYFPECTFECRHICIGAVQLLLANDGRSSRLPLFDKIYNATTNAGEDYCI